MLNAYIQGWKKLLRCGKMWVLLYLLNLLFAMFSVVPFYGLLGDTVGHSLGINESLNAFDYIILSDFLNEYGEQFYVFFDTSIGFLVLFFIFSIFLMGGILTILKIGRFDSGSFWQGCSRYFGRLCRLSLCFLLVQGIILGLAYFIFIKMNNGFSPINVESDQQFVDNFWIVTPIYLFLAIFFFMLQDYSKILIVQEERRSVLKTIRDAFRLLIKNFLKIFGLYLLNIVTFILCFTIYYYVNHLFRPNTEFTVFLLLLLGQSLVLARIGIKLLNLGSATTLLKQLV